MTPAETFAAAAARVAQENPRAWDEFKTAFRLYADSKRDLLVRASLEELQRSQGRAQQCAELSDLMTDAVNIADKLRQRTAK